MSHALHSFDDGLSASGCPLASTMDEIIRLNVCQHGPYNIRTSSKIFAVTDTIGEIAQERGAFFDSPVVIKVYDWEMPLASLERRLPRLNIRSLTPLEDRMLVSDIFPKDSEINPSHLHLLIQARHPAYLRAPDLPRFTVHRQNTVKALYERVRKHGLVHVRGTPGSGKSILASLLVEHIRTVEPDAAVTYIFDWPKVHPNWRFHLTQQDWEEGVGTYLIIDRAHVSYGDTNFWTEFLATLGPTSLDRVVLFAPYGCPTSSTMEDTSSPVVLSKGQRISFQPNAPDNDDLPLGLSFTRAEFDEFVGVDFPSARVDPSLLDFVYAVTRGHIGAFRSLLSATSDVHRSICTKLKDDNTTLTLDLFLQHMSWREVLSTLYGNYSVFLSGLPESSYLYDTPLTHVLWTTLGLHSVYKNDFTQESELLALERCRKHRWLHTEEVLDSKVAYFFPSLLHESAVQDLLVHCTNFDIPDTTILEFCISVARQMSIRDSNSPPRFLCGGTIQSRPETKYSDAFYRACVAYIQGSLILFPTCCTGDARLDFFIPSKKWRIQVVQHNMEENRDSFDSLSNVNWVANGDVEAAVMLDFRSNLPQQAHSDNTALYCVVIEDHADSVSVQILDNLLQVVNDGTFQVSRVLE